jgi:uncharacterized damage-inducible protein DinB
MSQPALTATEMMAWVDRTWDRWRSLIAAHPEALDLPCDIMGIATVGGLLQHVVAVELRDAERLSGLPETGYASIPFDSIESICATHRRAGELFSQQLGSDVDWDRNIDFTTRSMGPARSSRKTVLFHAMLHSARHLTQLATLLRQHGIRPDRPMDYLVMDLDPAS